MSNVIALNDDNFEQLAVEAEVALLDFWSETCKPCQALAPIIEALADDLASERRVLIGKIDVEQSPDVTDRFRIRGLPAILVLKKGEVVKKFLGVQSKETLLRSIGEHLA